MAKRQVTVKDIAERLHLHYTTVSKALRNHPDISPATKQLVLTLAEQLDYHPNSIARNLKKQQSHTIGVIVPSIKNDFFATVISGIEEVAYIGGFNIIVCQSNESHEREIANIRTLISNRIAGVIVSVAQTTTSGEHFRVIQKRGIPLVFFDRVCEGVEASKVVVDDHRGAFEAVQHLLASGYKKIAHFAGPDNISVSKDRYKGYVDALKKNNVSIDDDMIIRGGFEEKDGVFAFQELLSRAGLPDAIFAVNDLVAIGAYKQIKEQGLRIPGDVALVGFGDNVLSCYLDPPLTTVSQSPHDLGKISANVLLRQIENSEGACMPEMEVIKTELIVRKST